MARRAAAASAFARAARRRGDAPRRREFISPVSGPVAGDTEVTITGQNFPTHDATPVVEFVVGDSVLRVTGRVVNDRTVAAAVPPLDDALVIANQFLCEVYLEFEHADGSVEPVGLYRLRPTFRYFISPCVLAMSPTCAQASSDTALQLTMFSDMWGTRGSKVVGRDGVAALRADAAGLRRRLERAVVCTR